MFVLVIATLAYFGFYREGCICSIGAIQNVTLALGDSNYVVPMTVILFLALPMVFALLFGRVFCGGACPLGMIQEVVLIKPLRIPPWLANVLGVFPFLYLGLAVMLAFTGTAFIICRFDPFVDFFRLSGPIVMLGAGAALLALGTFVGRPYCRFACPYGAVLGLLSRVSWKHVTITPEDCVVCGLCEDACPYGAIDPPTPRGSNGSAGKNRLGRKALVFALIVILPLAGAGLGAWAGPGLARTNATVMLAQRIHDEQAGVVSDYSFESEAFRTTGRPVSDLYAEARRVERTFTLTGAVFGAWVGLVFALKFFGLNRSSARSEYVIRKADCVSCGRCLKACPTGRAGLKRVSAMASSTRSPE
jgi:ferredoxin